MRYLTESAETPLISIVVVTNGRAAHLKACLQAWMQIASLGRNLFVCGPREALTAFNLPPTAVIDHPVNEHDGMFFGINAKKQFAGENMPGQYLYFVHDRLFPSHDSLMVMEDVLRSGQYDFGAVDVNNEDGSPSLREMRLDSRAVAMPIDLALSRLSRLCVASEAPHASPHIAINGAQFFLKRDLLRHLGRPLRWFEMEDDVLSFDLKTAHGTWIDKTTLVSKIRKSFGQPQHQVQASLKHLLYSGLCWLSALRAFAAGHRNLVLAVSRLSERQLQERLATEIYLIDPLHKMTASDVLPSSLEKMMVRSRLLSKGQKFESIIKSKHGWLLR